MLEIEHRFRVVDVHARLDPEGEEAATRGRAVSPERLEREMRQAGVVRAVAFARINGPREPGDGAASRLQNLTASRRDWHTDPGDVEQYAYDDRFHGFKLNPAVDGLPGAETLDRLDDAGLPVTVHGGVEFPPSALAETLLDRGFPVVYEHFGGHPLQRDLMDGAISLLDRHDRLHLDTSYVRYRDRMERALMEHPDRVCFGSGAPTAHPNVGVMELLTLDVPEDAMRKAFSKNAARLVDALAAE